MFRLPHTMLILLSLLLSLSSAAISTADVRTLHVGPGSKYETPCQAFADAKDGDTVEIDAAGIYDGDVCSVSANKLVIRGINGRPRIDAAGEAAEEKAIWVVTGDDTIIENIELSGCRVPNKNGAGIRQAGTNLTVRSCFFHDNENGILCGKNPASQILVENTEFARNGFGDGYSHNIYIGNIKRFTMRSCYSHQANGGHLVKSRAAENHILYNRLTGEKGCSYELDLPNGGLAYVIGNIIQQSATTINTAMLSFGTEDPVPSSRLIVINNTFVNDRNIGLFIQIHRMVTKRSMIVNNIFAGLGELCSQGTALMLANFSGSDPGFLNRAGFDYHLKMGSPCIDAGADLEILGMKTVIPSFEYVHPCKSKSRVITGPLDIGAYERAPPY
jgi:hypothetical protein